MYKCGEIIFDKGAKVIQLRKGSISTNDTKSIGHSCEKNFDRKYRFCKI
jgi:hypothetical protein